MPVQETNPETLSLEERANIVETSEAKWFEAIFSGLSADITTEYGAEWQKLGGGTAVFFEKIPIPAFNRVIGLGVLTVLVLQARRGRFGTRYHTPIEMTGLYWHFVDIIWIFLFPLLYLIERHH